MQLYVVASVLTLWLTNRRRLALPLLALLTVASCLLNGALAYYFDWKSIMYHVYPRSVQFTKQFRWKKDPCTMKNANNF